MQKTVIWVNNDSINNIRLINNHHVLCERYGLQYIFVNFTTFQVEAKGRVKVIENISWM